MYEIIERKPACDEFIGLQTAVGWHLPESDAIIK